MLVTIYIALVGVSAALALVSFRIGLWLMLLVGLLGDPIRKLTPENPVLISAYFTLIFAATCIALAIKADKKNTIFHHYPVFKTPVYFYFICLGLAFFNGISQKIAPIPLIFFGLAQYAGIILAVRVGYYSLRCEKDFLTVVRTYIITVSPFLWSVLPHFLNLQDKWPILNTMRVEGGVGYQFHSGQKLAMLNGIFRTPEPMGWNAMMVVAGCIFLLARGQKSILWKLYLCFMSLFGFFCILVSGRRKFFLGIAVFVLSFLFMIMIKNPKKMIITLISILILFGVGWNYVKDHKGLEHYLASEMSVYSSDKDITLDGRLKEGVVGSVFYAIDKCGIFGLGLGVATQGSAHFQAGSGVLIEAGSGKIFAELGVQGFLSLLLILGAYFYAIYRIIKMKWFRGPLSMSSAFLFSLIITHILSFLVSYQIYGDPLIALLTGLAFGMLLAIPRMAMGSR